ncbi:MAG: hypothetical protein IPK52_16235 [Chloroflexi bacterium]|nr:hypothetical protein [Chloroflexota bacterium]
MLAMVEAHGGRVSYKDNGDGTRSPYEMNITCFDAITDPAVTEHEPQTAAHRFPLFAGYHAGVRRRTGDLFPQPVRVAELGRGVTLHGYNRAINRQKFGADDLTAELARPDSLRARGLYRGISGCWRHAQMSRPSTRSAISASLTVVRRYLGWSALPQTRRSG